MTQRQHLGSELGIGWGADQGEVGEVADKLVEEGEEHGGGSCPIDPRPARATVSRPLQVNALPAQGAGIRVDAARCTGHALRDLAVVVEHIRSTSVPGLAAKPVVNIAVVLTGVDVSPTSVAGCSRWFSVTARPWHISHSSRSTRRTGAAPAVPRPPARRPSVGPRVRRAEAPGWRSSTLATRWPTPRAVSIQWTSLGVQSR
ncbi:MAG TPA: GrpB family protein [Candidatus Dormibacteraeota bacterium]|nr:GrpB family protein [Candidatus Dormibacteraeota bacterium]